MSRIKPLLCCDCRVYSEWCGESWPGYNKTDCGLQIESSAIITWSNLSGYYMRQCNNRCRKWVRHYNHNRHPIPRPHGRAMGRLLWEFGENWPCYNGTALYWEIVCNISSHPTCAQHEGWSIRNIADCWPLFTQSATEFKAWFYSIRCDLILHLCSVAVWDEVAEAGETSLQEATGLQQHQSQPGHLQEGTQAPFIITGNGLILPDGIKLLTEQMLIYCQLEQILLKFHWKYQTSH